MGYGEADPPSPLMGYGEAGPPSPLMGYSEAGPPSPLMGYGEAGRMVGYDPTLHNSNGARDFGFMIGRTHGSAVG